MALGLQPTPAAARGFFDWFESDPPRSEPGRYWGPQSYPRAAPEAYGRRHSKTAGARQRREAKPAEISSLERPLFAVISIADQRVSIYNHHGLVERSAISTGMAGHPTPKGVFTIIGRERFHRSNIYSGAPMPFMQRITWSGIAMHLGVVPGHPASHGCIRLPAGFAAKLWGLTKIGERVVISPQDVTPVEFTHPLLPAPKMQVQTVAEARRRRSARRRPRVAAAAAADQSASIRRAAQGQGCGRDGRGRQDLKEMSAAVRVKRQEAARAAAELKAAEAAYDFSSGESRHRGQEPTKRWRPRASAKQQELILVAELNAADGDICDSADARRPAKDDELAATAKDAAATAKMNAEAALADAAAKLETATNGLRRQGRGLADAVRRLNEATAGLRRRRECREGSAACECRPSPCWSARKTSGFTCARVLRPCSMRRRACAIRRRRSVRIFTSRPQWKTMGLRSNGRSCRSPIRGRRGTGRAKRKTASVDEQVGAPPKLHGSPSSAAEALERIEIAQDVRDRIAERLWTGGSLIISDQPLSGETGAVGTDLTVKVR